MGRTSEKRKNGKAKPAGKSPAKGGSGGSLSRPAVILALAAAALIVLAACVFTYRFLFYTLPEREARKAAEAESEELLSAEPEPSPASDGEVEAFAVSVYVNGKETPCLYTGMLASGAPSGKGLYEFQEEGGALWSFFGECPGGLIGTGSAENMPVEFGTDEVSNSGRYTGALRGGVPDGEGTLSVSADDGSGFTYTGGWSKGAYNGYGELIYDSENIITYIGNFVKGQFRPTASQLIAALSSGGGYRAGLDAQVLSFLEQHENDFLEHNASAFRYDRFEPDIFSRNIENNTDSCFRCDVVIEQKIEYGADLFGIPVAELLATANAGAEVLHGYWLGDSSSVTEKSIRTLRAYPIRNGTLTDSAGKSYDAVVFVALSLE